MCIYGTAQYTKCDHRGKMTLVHLCANARGQVDPALQGKALLDECMASATLKNRYQPESYATRTFKYFSRWSPWSSVAPLNPCTIQEKQSFPFDFIDDFCPGCYYWQKEGYPKAPWAPSSRDTFYLGASPPNKYETNVWNTYAGCWVPKGGDITSSKSSSMAERVEQATIDRRKENEREYRKRTFGTWQVTRYPHNDLPYDEWVDETEELDDEFKSFEVKTTEERHMNRTYAWFEPTTEQEKSFFEPRRSIRAGRIRRRPRSDRKASGREHGAEAKRPYKRILHIQHDHCTYAPRVWKLVLPNVVNITR